MNVKSLSPGSLVANVVNLTAETVIDTSSLDKMNK